MYILVVDDDDDASACFATVLRAEGHRVVTCHSAADAHAVLDSAPVPDLILSDVVMPGVNGVELRRALKRDPRLRRIPVVFLSAMRFPNGAYHELDGAPMLPKPFDADALLRILAEASSTRAE